MVNNVIKYKLDKTGEDPDNWVRSENHILTPGKVRTLILDSGYFFRDGLEIVDVLNGGTLTYNIDYGLIGYNEIASMEAGREVFGAIQIRNSEVNDELAVTYRAVGGRWSSVLDLAVGFIETIENDSRSVAWGEVLGTPNRYRPDVHYHTIKDGYNFNGLLTSIKNLNDKINNLNQTLVGVNDTKISNLAQSLKQLSTNLKDNLLGQVGEIGGELSKRFEKQPEDLGFNNLKNYGTANITHFNLKLTDKYVTPKDFFTYLERSATGQQIETVTPLWYNGEIKKPGTFYSGDERPGSTINNLYFNGYLKAHKVQTGGGDLFSNENPPSLDDIIEAGYKYWIDDDDVKKQSSKRLFIDERPAGEFVPVDDTFYVDSDELNAYSLKRNVIVSGMVNNIKVGVSETNGLVLGFNAEKPVRIAKEAYGKLRFEDYHSGALADVTGNILNFGTYDVDNLYLNSDTSIKASGGGKTTYVEALDNGKHTFNTIGAFTWKQAGLGNSDSLFPAFIKNGVPVTHIKIGNAPVSLANGKLNTTTGVSPLSDVTLVNLETYLTNSGTDFQLMNIWDFLATYIYLTRTNKLPLAGNTNYGRFGSDVDSYGVRVDGGTVGTTTGNPLTLIGSGPLSWNSGEELDGLVDFIGNVREYISGVEGNSADTTKLKFIPDGGVYDSSQYVTNVDGVELVVDGTNKKLKLMKDNVELFDLNMSSTLPTTEDNILVFDLDGSKLTTLTKAGFSSILNGCRLTNLS